MIAQSKESCGTFLRILIFASFVVVAAWNTPPCDCRAEDRDLTEGDSVKVLADATELRAGDTVLATLPKGQKLEVVKLGRGWVLTVLEQDGKQVRGWVLRRSVELIATHSAKAPSTTSTKSTIAALEALGAKITIDKEGHAVEVVLLTAKDPISASNITLLTKLPKLRRLVFGFTEMGNSSLEPLKGLPHLTKLSLFGREITDEGMVHLTGMAELRELQLGWTKVGDAGLKRLAAFRRLERLDFSPDGQRRFLNLQNAYRAALPDDAERLPKVLRSLALRARLFESAVITYSLFGNHMITDAGVHQLSQLTSLTELDLSGVKITDASLKELKSLANLRRLNLFDAEKVTDAGLAQLEHVTRLSRLVLPIVGGNSYTEAGVVHLQKALPECKIASEFNLDMLGDDEFFSN